MAGRLQVPCGVTVHHSATIDDRVLNYPAIYRYHTENKGWSDIGYHAVVEMSSRGPVGLFGRPTTIFGAHARGHNDTLGICIVGNYDIHPPPQILTDLAIRRVIVPWCLAFGFTERQVKGHREHHGVVKTCPGSLFDLDRFRSEIRSKLEWHQSTSPKPNG